MAADAPVSPSCGQVLEGVPIPSPSLVAADSTALVLGALLAHSEVPSGILIDGESTRAIYGYQLVNFLLDSESPKEIYQRLFKPAFDIPAIDHGVPITTLKLSDSFKKAMDSIVANRFGDVLLTDDEGKLTGILSLGVVLNAMARRADRIGNIGLPLGEVASPLIAIDKERSVIEICRFMMRNRVRRAVVNAGGTFHYCTEREMLGAVFSYESLQSIRNEEAALFSKPFNSAPPIFKKAPALAKEVDVATAWSVLAQSQDTIVIVDGTMIATPWDLVVKPFLRGKFPAP